MTESKRDYAAESLKMHYEKRGKIEVVSTVPVRTREDLSLAYTSDQKMEHVPGGYGRNSRTRARRHRTGGGNACDGGQMRSV